MLKQLNENSQTAVQNINAQLLQILNHQNAEQVRTIETLMQRVDKRLAEIGGLVETRLNKGFEQTGNLFSDVIKRLAGRCRTKENRRLSTMLLTYSHF